MADERLDVLRDLEEGISYYFRDISLLDNALTHSSFVNERPSFPCRDNERLEFLGDAVLGLCISDMLMRKFPDYAEGQLSKLRASVVNEQSLAELARRFSIGDYLLLGKGEDNSGGREKNSLLADTFEALIAAMYLDSGFHETLTFVRRLFSSLIEEGVGETSYRDYKTLVQVLAQMRFREAPRYTIIAEHGPDHDKTFEMELTLAGFITTVGTGKNKKEAEQQAAKKALSIMEAEAVSEDLCGSAGKEE